MNNHNYHQNNYSSHYNQGGNRSYHSNYNAGDHQNAPNYNDHPGQRDYQGGNRSYHSNYNAGDHQNAPNYNDHPGQRDYDAGHQGGNYDAGQHHEHDGFYDAVKQGGDCDAGHQGGNYDSDQKLHSEGEYRTAGASQETSDYNVGEVQKEEEKEAEEDSSDEDTEFCKYCKTTFTTPRAYHSHTRGVQHISLVMQAKSEKGDVHYQKEKVDLKVSGEGEDQTAGTSQETSDYNVGEVQKEEEKEAEEDSSDEDTEFCKYCKTTFTTPRAYHAHTRGLQHINLVMQAKSEKGDKHYQKEKVDPKVLGEGEDQKTGASQKTSDYNVGEVQKEEEEEAEEDSSDEDTEFCKYCKTTFTTPRAYHAHTRGVQHISFVMQAKSEKGDKHYQKEKVDQKVLEVEIPAPVKPLTGDEKGKEIEAALNSNNLNLSEDCLQYLRDKRDVSKRDLNPTDLEKPPYASSSELACPVCDILCSGPIVFKSHIEGKQHKNNLALIEQGVLVKKKKGGMSTLFVEAKGKSARIQEDMMKEEGPILGLDYVTEFQKPDSTHAARYVCNVCESKCDGSTIIPHVLGIKHRLNYFKAERPSLFSHACTFAGSSKSKKITFTHDQAVELEKEVGRGEVRVKLELGDSDEPDLTVDMKRLSKSLFEKVKDAKEKAESGPADKMPRDAERENDTRRSEAGRGRGRMSEERGRVDEYGRRREPDRYAGYGARREYDYDRGHDYRQDYRSRYYDDRRGYGRQSYYDDRPPPRYPPVDFRDRYREMFEPYKRYEDAAYYDRRMYEERNHLDSLLLDRHRLNDTDAERRRVDDIMARREYLKHLDDARVKDRLERKRHLEAGTEEEDVDMLRLKRFMAIKGRHTDVASSTAATSSSEPPRRRHGNETAPPPSTSQPSAAQGLDAAKLLEQEMAKNPHLNINEVMMNLSSSIRSEDDAKMALQISSALTNALAQWRGQHANKQTGDVPQRDPDIPGLGNSSSANVPSFLKSKKGVSATSYSHDVNTGSPSTAAASPSNSYNYAKTSVYPGYQPAGVVQAGTQSSRVQQQTSQANQQVYVVNVDNPHRQLLESIRKQTDLIRQKIASHTMCNPPAPQP